MEQAIKITEAELKELQRQVEVVKSVDRDRQVYLAGVLRSHGLDMNKVWNVDLETGVVSEHGVIPKSETPQEAPKAEEPKKEEPKPETPVA